MLNRHPPSRALQICLTRHHMFCACFFFSSQLLFFLCLGLVLLCTCTYAYFFWIGPLYLSLSLEITKSLPISKINQTRRLCPIFPKARAGPLGNRVRLGEKLAPRELRRCMDATSRAPSRPAVARCIGVLKAIAIPFQQCPRQPERCSYWRRRQQRRPGIG